MNALDRAIQLAGGQAALAAKIGKRQSNISAWRKTNRVAPEFCILIEGAVGGAVTRYDLRPDVFGSPPAPSTSEAPQQSRAA